MSRAWYKTRRWRALRRAALERDQHICQSCNDWANHVDHIIPRRKRPDLFFTLWNLQSLCGNCHQEKTNRENPDHIPERADWIKYLREKHKTDMVELAVCQIQLDIAAALREESRAAFETMARKSKGGRRKKRRKRQRKEGRRDQLPGTESGRDGSQNGNRAIEEPAAADAAGVQGGAEVTEGLAGPEAELGAAGDGAGAQISAREAVEIALASALGSGPGSARKESV
ncbi:MAG: HNH endonuclease signature motif containing protein [Chloroflexi bacterium]|nr:HNH endonuclease signature motif containing protein [Chloroflexota bacterium]